MSSARSPSPIPRERLNGGSPNSDGSCLPSDQPPSSLNATGPNRLGQRGMASALVRVNGSSANLSQFLATCLLLEKQTEDLTALWCYQIFEWMSFFSVIYLAQWTSHLFLLLVLLAMYGLAAVRAEDLRSPLLRPIYMFLPERHSCFGLCHEQQSALLYQSSAALLRLGSLLLWLLLIVSMPEQDICVVPITNFVDKTCQDVPMWLSSGCGTFFAPKEYRNCVATSWMQYGYCNLLAAQCRNQALGKINLPISIVFNSGISLMSVLAPFLWLGCVLWLSVRKGFCIFNTPRASELTLAIREAEIDLSEDVEQYQVFIGPSLKRLLRLCRCLQLDLGAFAAADSQQLWSQHLWPAPQAPGRHGCAEGIAEGLSVRRLHGGLLEPRVVGTTAALSPVPLLTALWIHVCHQQCPGGCHFLAGNPEQFAECRAGRLPPHPPGSGCGRAFPCLKQCEIAP